MQLKSQEDKLDKLKELKYDENCQYCMNNVFVKDAIETKKVYQSQKEDYEQLNDRYETLKEDVDKLYVQVQEFNEVLRDQNAAMQIDAKIGAIKLAAEKIGNKIREAKAVILQLEADIVLSVQEQENKVKNRETQNKIAQLNEDLKITESSLVSIEKDTTAATVSLRLAENEVKKCNASIDKVKSLESTVKLYQAYMKAVHRDGVPHRLISNTIPQIQDEVNNILSQLVEFNIVFQSDDKNINAYIAYGEENYWPLELTSGMEKFVSSLAIRVALINVSALPRPNFIAIDEGFGALDKTNLNSMIMLFDYLKTQFKFSMIVSHIESMRDVVDRIIEITKTNGRSRIDHQ